LPSFTVVCVVAGVEVFNIKKQQVHTHINYALSLYTSKHYVLKFVLTSRISFTDKRI